MTGISTCSPVLEPGRVGAVSYALEVGGGRLDRVVRELYGLGCTDINQGIPGYLVVTLTPALCAYVQTVRGVVRMFPAVGTEFDRPVTQPPERPRLCANEMVRILSGTYAGLTGILRAVNGSMVTVELLMFGRMRPIEMAADHVDRVPVPAPWRD